MSHLIGQTMALHADINAQLPALIRHAASLADQFTVTIEAGGHAIAMQGALRTTGDKALLAECYIAPSNGELYVAFQTP